MTAAEAAAVREDMQRMEDRLAKSIDDLGERLDDMDDRHHRCVTRCSTTRAPMYAQINKLSEKVAGMSGRQIAVTMIIVGPLTGILASLLTIGVQKLLGW